jgi:ElaB/YqjD/DUF883 family membrane-anchored ribosome-binding protein
MAHAEWTREETPNVVDRAGAAASRAADKAQATVDSQRQKAANTLDQAADSIDRQADRLPDPLNDYADSVKSALDSTADYVRHNNARQMADDAASLVSDHPLASLLILGAAVAGAGVLLASVMGGDSESSASSGHRLHAASGTVWGPRTAAVVAQFRDALFSLAVARTVQTVDEMFPGFREHFEKA